MPSKMSSLVALLFLSVLTLGGISVMGLLQSTDRVGTSGIVVLPSPQPSSTPLTLPTSPPPEPKINIDLFVDEECTIPLSSFEWGKIEAGGTSKRSFYVKNSGEINVVINLKSENWSPTESNDFMRLSWDYDGSQIEPDEIRYIELQLSVDSECPNDNFSFDIIIIGS
jgi:hypothetical protein